MREQRSEGRERTMRETPCRKYAGANTRLIRGTWLRVWCGFAYCLVRCGLRVAGCVILSVAGREENMKS